MTVARPLADSHAHLTYPPLSDDLHGVLRRAAAAGVERILTVSASHGDAAGVVAVAEAHAGVTAAIGVHPHEASLLDAADERELETLAAREVVVAIGETGLDYHYDRSPRDTQQRAFRRQVRVARDVGLPIVVHSRAADDDTAEILADEGAEEVGGVIHCFTGGWPLAERCLEMGFAISISGIVTFPKAEELREVARRVPLERLLVETDSPYLAPVPHRGKPNEPAHVRVTAEKLADVRGEDPDALARATSENFERLFSPGPERLASG